MKQSTSLGLGIKKVGERGGGRVKDQFDHVKIGMQRNLIKLESPASGKPYDFGGRAFEKQVYRRLDYLVIEQVILVVHPYSDYEVVSCRESVSANSLKEHLNSFRGFELPQQLPIKLHNMGGSVLGDDLFVS